MGDSARRRPLFRRRQTIIATTSSTTSRAPAANHDAACSPAPTTSRMAMSSRPSARGPKCASSSAYPSSYRCPPYSMTSLSNRIGSSLQTTRAATSVASSASMSPPTSTIVARSSDSFVPSTRPTWTPASSNPAATSASRTGSKLSRRSAAVEHPDRRTATTNAHNASMGLRRSVMVKPSRSGVPSEWPVHVASSRSPAPAAHQR